MSNTEHRMSGDVSYQAPPIVPLTICSGQNVVVCPS